MILEMEKDCVYSEQGSNKSLYGVRGKVPMVASAMDDPFLGPT